MNLKICSIPYEHLHGNIGSTERSKPLDKAAFWRALRRGVDREVGRFLSCVRRAAPSGVSREVCGQSDARAAPDSAGEGVRTAASRGRVLPPRRSIFDIQVRRRLRCRPRAGELLPHSRQHLWDRVSTGQAPVWHRLPAGDSHRGRPRQFTGKMPVPHGSAGTGPGRYVHRQDADTTSTSTFTGRMAVLHLH